MYVSRHKNGFVRFWRHKPKFNKTVNDYIGRNSEECVLFMSYDYHFLYNFPDIKLDSGECKKVKLIEA